MASAASSDHSQPDWLTSSVILTNSYVGTRFPEGASAMGLVGLAKQDTIMREKHPAALSRASLAEQSYYSWPILH